MAIICNSVVQFTALLPFVFAVQIYAGTQTAGGSLTRWKHCNLTVQEEKSENTRLALYFLSFTYPFTHHLSMACMNEISKSSSCLFCNSPSHLRLDCSRKDWQRNRRFSVTESVSHVDHQTAAFPHLTPFLPVAVIQSHMAAGNSLAAFVLHSK